LYTLLRVSSLRALEEKVLVIGASSGWSAAENRVQVTEIPVLRPFPVLALSSARPEHAENGAAETPARQDIPALYEAYRNFPADESAVDFSLSFDQASPSEYRDARGRYRVETSPALQGAAGRWARYGSGAALFAGVTDREEGVPLRISPERGIFSPGRGMRNFSIEFWLYPNNLENGEQILAWTAVLPGKNETLQRIFCEAVRNRIRWTFQNFFIAPGGPDQHPALVISRETRKSLVPRTWTHHLVRYDADTGLLEYLVDGEPENAAYTTLSGREGGDVHTPYPGRDGFFVLGGRYSGLMDEFRIYREAIPGRGNPDTGTRGFLEMPDPAKFPKSGGRFETRTIDLGEPGTTVLRLEASGGRYTAGTAKRRPVRNIYEGKGDFRFSDDSTIQFFFKAGEDPYQFNRAPWIPVTPGTELSGRIRGRYIQLAAAFYPGRDCETGPYLEEIRIIYESNEAPYPPSLVTAKALDGAVELNWRASPDSDTTGYMVYYGTSSGVYYGEGAVQGGSPVDAGKRTSLRLEGLKNGVLYFFAVAAYDGSGGLHAGKFSKEVTARPLRTSE
jgi:hypothetical protein